MTIPGRLPRRRRGHGTENWARRQGELLLSVAELIETLPDASGTKPGLREDVTALDLARSIAVTVARNRADRRIALGTDLSGSGALIRAAAVERLTARPQVGTRTLGETLADAWELAAAVGRPLSVDPAVSRAVAAERLKRAPLALRLGVRGRRLIASDAGWELGKGEPLAGSAAAIVLYLHGRSPLPSRGSWR